MVGVGDLELQGPAAWNFHEFFFFFYGRRGWEFEEDYHGAA